MKAIELYEIPHRRYNILTGEWVLVSPHRSIRPWQGKLETTGAVGTIDYDSQCYLCPGNQRMGDSINEQYTDVFVFKNDFAALMEQTPDAAIQNGLLQAKSERGVCKVICFSPNHSLTLPQMAIDSIVKVIETWQNEYLGLGSLNYINHVQIFENKGEIMGCSNPHPHGQIWAQSSIPKECQLKTIQMSKYWNENGRSLLGDYMEQELEEGTRIIAQNEAFVALAPFWAIWPYEAMIIPRRHMRNISEMNEDEKIAFAQILKYLTIKFDNVFNTSFPYSAGLHQAPTDGVDHAEWHWHMSFYPPLLRSASIKKHMVGYELFAEPQRDITVESAAECLRTLSAIHYLEKHPVQS